MRKALEKLYGEVAAYSPFNEQEQCDQELMLRYLEGNDDCLERSSLAHFATSIWTVDPALTKTVMAYHNIYKSWAWIGGHADGEADLSAVALRELSEETGISQASLVRCGIYSIEVCAVSGHVKRDAYVSSHLHLNVTYLAVADPAAPLRVKPDENSGVKWVPLSEVCGLSKEPWIRDCVYAKLIEKLGIIDRALIDEAASCLLK